MIIFKKVLSLLKSFIDFTDSNFKATYNNGIIVNSTKYKDVNL